MKAYIGLGSNLGETQKNLELAGQALSTIGTNLRASPVFRTPALLPAGGPDAWDMPYANAVLEMEWTGRAIDLLGELQRIEVALGRSRAPRWAPRVIDLDLLALGEEIQHSPACQVPHPEALRRSFVLDPWKHLRANLVLPGQTKNILSAARESPARAPLWLGILNLTPDSFSDGGELSSSAAFRQRLEGWERAGVQVWDFGAESTRPGAQAITAEEEWGRLAPALDFAWSRLRGRIFRPWISVDTYRASVAARALSLGADWINDVSGLADPEMLELLQSSNCHYVLMHSLSVPADPKLVFPATCDPLRELKYWLEDKLNLFSKSNIDLDRVIFDPGIGFGKSAQQSLRILQRISEFSDFPVRILVGHSRKSFLKLWGLAAPKDREAASLGLSLALAGKGVDCLRVHEAASHADAWHAFQELRGDRTASFSSTAF